MKKKTVYVDLFYLNTALTGIKTYILEFCEAVNENSSTDIKYIFSHDYLTQGRSTFYRGNVAYWKKLFYHVYYFIWKQLILPFKVKKSGANVLLCFDFIAPAFPLNVKKMVVIHDAFFWQMPQNYNHIWRKYFITMIHAGLKGNSTVITTSLYARKALEKSSGIRQNIAVIYQCPKLLPESVNQGVLDKLGLEEKSYFLHVGSFDKRKMIPTLVTAFAEIEKQYTGQFLLVLVGERGLSSALDDYEQIIQKIKEKDLGKRVLLPGFLPDEEVKSLYQNAFAYVFPSANEGFGIPVIEAMSNGIPVIVSNQEALMEIAGGAALVHSIGDVASLTEKMDTLIKNPQLLTKLVEKGNERSKHFNRSSFLSRFEALIRIP
jgi:glycosyltransferase involved in cell wall biosynthesis